MFFSRAYHTIPSSGAGSSGTNYDRTGFGYSIMKRRNRTVSPGGEITFVVYEVRGLVLKTYVGTNDAGASENDPTGGGAGGNNMKLVTENHWVAPFGCFEATGATHRKIVSCHTVV